jgi:TIR domain
VKKIMDREVFISHSSKDLPAAQAICRALEAKGVLCSIAPRNMVAGMPYTAPLARAIASCRVFLLLLSRHSNASPMVRREVERAIARRKPVLTVRLENVPPSEGLELLVSDIQWFDAFGMEASTYLPDLCAKVRLLLSASGYRLPDGPGAADGKPPIDRPAGAENPRPGFKLRYLMAAGALLALALVAVVLVAARANHANPERRPPDAVTVSSSSREDRQKEFKRRAKSFEDTMLNEDCSPADQQILEAKGIAARAPASEQEWMNRDIDRLDENCRIINQHTQASHDLVMELRAKRVLPKEP